MITLNFRPEMSADIDVLKSMLTYPAWTGSVEEVPNDIPADSIHRLVGGAVCYKLTLETEADAWGFGRALIFAVNRDGHRMAQTLDVPDTFDGDWGNGQPVRALAAIEAHFGSEIGSLQFLHDYA